MPEQLELMTLLWGVHGEEVPEAPSDYRQARLPAGNDIHGYPVTLWVNVCNDCGALVLDQTRHSAWHEEIWLASAVYDDEGL